MGPYFQSCFPPNASTAPIVVQSFRVGLVRVDRSMLDVRPRRIVVGREHREEPVGRKRTNVERACANC